MTKSDSKSAQPKQAVVVDDSLYPMPRPVLTSRDILDQIGASPNVSLKRDYNGSRDHVFDGGESIDLRHGNVFTTVPKCDPRPCNDSSAKPKLAFVLDVEDAWEITLNPNQTGKSLKRLFGIADDCILSRDLESPNDVPIGDDEPVNYADGPVFTAKLFSLTIKVNKKPVTVAKRRLTGLEIKQAAIDQGVNIKASFVLYEMKQDGDMGPAIPDDKKVTLHDCDEFRCVAPDDNS